MIRIISALFVLSLFFTGCGPSEKGDSVAWTQQMMDNQRMHYRPVHHTETRWSIIDRGNSLVLRTSGGESLRASARHGANRTVVRRGGFVVGNVTRDGSVVRFSTVSREGASTRFASISCDGRDRAVMNVKDKTIHIQFNAADTQAQSEMWHVKRYARHRLAFEANSPDSDKLSEGQPLEVPFNALGTLIFNSDEDMPLDARFALASYVTAFKFKCTD